MDFCEYFEQRLNNPLENGIILKYNTLRNSPGYEKLIFVEGSSDEKFYGNTSINSLTKSAKYIYQDYEEKDGGKEAVFFAYNQIKNNPDLAENGDKCIYIVDRDWDMTLRSKNKWVSKKDEANITLTQGHSMESYFLEMKNLETMFEVLDIKKHYQEFKELYADFAKRSESYWALKGTVIFANKMGKKCRYKKCYDFSDIFKFDFSKEEYFLFDRLTKEEGLMYESIKGDEDLLRYYGIWKKKISEEPRFIRGHDAYNFLLAFIKSKTNGQVKSKELFALVNKFEVCIDIKQP